MIGLESLQHQLLGVDDRVVLLDGFLGRMAVYVHLVHHLFEDFELRIDVFLLYI